MKRQPESIAWESMALVGFENGRPVIISLIRPEVLFDTFFDLVDWDDDRLDKPDDFMIQPDYDPEFVRQLVQGAVAGIEWKLYPTEIAKEVFCSKGKGEVQPVLF